MKKIITIGLCLVMVTTFAFAEVVRSEDFVLTGNGGKTIGRMTTSGEGTPALFMYDNNGVVRISIGLYADGAPGVVLNDEKGLAGAIMRLVNNDGRPVLVLKEDGQDKYIVSDKGVELGGSQNGGGGVKTIIISVVLSSFISIVATLALIAKGKETSLPIVAPVPGTAVM